MKAKYICVKCKKKIDTEQTDVEGADFVIEQAPEKEIYWHRFCWEVTPLA